MNSDEQKQNGENHNIVRNPHMMTGDLYFHERIGDYLHKYGISIMENNPWVRVGAVDGLYLELCYFMAPDEEKDCAKLKENMWIYFGKAIGNKIPNDVKELFSISDQLMQKLVKIAHKKKLLLSSNERRS